MSPFAHPADPGQADMSAARLEETKAWIERQTGTRLYGCLIVRRGTLAAEWYGGGFTAQSLFEIGSIRKSFNSALIGLGIEQGIVDLDARAADYGYNWFVNDGQSLWPGAPPDAYGHPGNGTFKPSEEPSRAYLWICPSLEIVAAIVATVPAGSASDYLQVLQTVTAEWVRKIVCAIVQEQTACR